MVFERALDALLADLDRKKLAATARPRESRRTAPGSRHIPAAVRREVWRRDGARCVFLGATGRCTERGFLELHHVVPFAAGGEATASNIELRCRAHNAYEAEQFFGSFTLREHPALYNSVQTESATWHNVGAGSMIKDSSGRRIFRTDQSCGHRSRGVGWSRYAPQAETRQASAIRLSALQTPQAGRPVDVRPPKGLKAPRRWSDLAAE
jgi:hypothetical protein